MLATALSLALGSGTALAAYAPDPPDTPDTPATGDPTEQERLPAAPQPTSQDQERDTDTNQATNNQTAEASDRAKNIESVDLLFDTASSDLTADARKDLLTLARWAKCNPDGAVILEGHADPRGSQDLNMRLSAERAAAVREKLVEMGVPSEHIVITVYGKNGPSRDSYAQDRRVTVRAAATPVPPEDITAER
ncbi:MAG TPA: OmpA family protein [Kofleriaceae bacterium]|jgi:outer membrane protein OmpA-like peptidoglycan-associated protein